MKKAAKYLLIGLIFQGGFNLNAQEAASEKSILEKFSVTPQVGLLRSWGDFDTEALNGFLNQNKLGVNLLLNYKLNKFISISAGGLYGKLSGTQDDVNTANAKVAPVSDLGLGVLFKTDLFELTLPRIDLNVTRLIFKDKSKFFNKFSIGLIGSHGLVFSDAKIYAQQDEELNLNYVNPKAKSDKRGNSGSTIEAVTSYGLGLSYIINDRFDIGVESTIRNVWNDRLDAWETDGTANDKYSYTAVGVTYHLRKRKTVNNFVNYTPDALAKKENVTDSEPKESDPMEYVGEVREVEEEVAKVEEEAAKVEEEVAEVEEEAVKVIPEVAEKKESVSNKLKVEDFKDDVIKFELNSSRESAALNNQVRSIAEKMKNSPSTNITLGGYTDKSGSESFNKTLSIQRAKWVKDQLVRKYGISNDRITVIGHGEAGTDKELDPNNRKVEVIEVR